MGTMILATAGTSMVTEAMKTALTTAFQNVAGDVQSIATIALPVGLGVAGLFIAIRLGIGFFKSVAN